MSNIGIFVWLFSKNNLEWFYIAWIAISFLAFYLKIDQNIILKLLSVRFAPYFVFGGMLALVVDRFKTSIFSTRFMYLSVLFFSAVLPLYVSASLIAQKDTITNFTGSFDLTEMKIVESFFIIVPLFVYGSYYFQSKSFTKVALALGGITYPLYLLHWTIGKTILSPHTKYGTVTKLSVVFAIILVAVSYLLSVLELPVRKMLKKKLLS